jgi:hypothetical protein
MAAAHGGRTAATSKEDIVSNHATEEVSVNIFQDSGNPQRIFIWSADGAKSPFRDEHGHKPGFKWTVSADPDSADYDPTTASAGICATKGSQRPSMTCLSARAAWRTAGACCRQDCGGRSGSA